MSKAGKIRYDFSVFGEMDSYLFREGNHFRLYEKLGAQVVDDGKERGTYFGLWAPNAREVSVVGSFNGWDRTRHYLSPRKDSSGIWEGFVPGVGKGALYKFSLRTRSGSVVEKGDPFASFWEIAPKTASIVWPVDYKWGDGDWMKNRRERNALDAPMSIYEVHVGSWRRKPAEGFRSLSYRELGHELGEYVLDAGFTHVELLPVMEHPFYASWGYQTLGYFAPTSRYGTPEDFMYMIDVLHQMGIGVFLDWVPSHFPEDGYGLARFDGTCIYEHEDPRQGFQPDWGSRVFNFGRNEVREFLISSAFCWLDRFHADGLRVDAVASMLYLDYSRKQGEWVPNKYGGNENLEAVSFLKRMNEAIYKEFPDVQTMAEESTAWPMVTRPTYLGGLGFGMKWNMGWMHDTLQYMRKDPVHRKYEHNKITFSIMYAFTENFLLPFSHDEVVHGKGSMLGKMPGDEWQQYANLRLLLGYMYAHPGKKLLFMGSEFAQGREWDHDDSLFWDLLNYPRHEGMLRWVRDLNRVYREEPALHERDFSHEGFSWCDFSDWEQSVVSFFRRSESGETVLTALNFTPVPRIGYTLHVPVGGNWKELLNSDAEAYGGGGIGNLGGVTAREASGSDWHPLTINLPPLGAVMLKPE
ncbi:MAG: 1,4-alpha-glucan branching protein GlgB [Synergistota bacterium]|nr:1,4-alpha-glucan branching protein GlgB [Synergistota bacterium]